MGELRIPKDPEGIEEPHDVLAADEFAMPSGPDRVLQTLKSGDTSNPLLILGAAAFAGLLLYAVVRRR